MCTWLPRFPQKVFDGSPIRARGKIRHANLVVGMHNRRPWTLHISSPLSYSSTPTSTPRTPLVVVVTNPAFAVADLYVDGFVQDITTVFTWWRVVVVMVVVVVMMRRW